MKRDKSPRSLLALWLLVAAGGVAAQTADSPRLTPACQVERATGSDSKPGSGFSISIGGFALGGGGGGGGGQRSSSGGNEGFRGDTAASADTADVNRSQPRGSENGRDAVRGGSGGNVGVGLNFDLGELFRRLKSSEVPNRLSENGPRFESAFSMACIPVRGFVRGGWPLVLDYLAEPGTIASVEVHVEGRDTVLFPLRSGRERSILKLRLPEQLGGQLSPALILVRGVKDQPGPPVLGRVHVFGLGAGPRAVGSVAIDQVEFKPGTVSFGKKQNAHFSFYSRSDFNRAAAEVLRVVNRDGDLQVSLARSIPLQGGVAAGTWVGRQGERIWDGSDANRQASIGQHLMQVRAWLGAQEGGDWVAAWSAESVEVTR